MARPKKEEHERRNASTRADLTAAEKEYIREQAAKAGLSEADYVRRRILGFTVQPPAPKADAARVSELNRIGVNVNQLARATNADREFRGDWRDVERELRRLLEKVAAAYGS